jgi:hypothetical protein
LRIASHGPTSIFDSLFCARFEDRREARFMNMKDILSKKSALEQVVRDWVALVEE